jgi:hypothetical protein
MPDGSPQMTQTWVDTDGGAEHIEALAQRYLGTPYPWYGGRDQVRVILTIKADRVARWAREGLSPADANEAEPRHACLGSAIRTAFARGQIPV